MEINFKSLKSYIDILREHNLLVDTNCNLNESINYISYNSNDIKENTLFVCKGNNFKKEYLINSISKGITTYISEEKYEDSNLENINYIIVNDVRKALALIANIYYDFPWKNLKMIGITGTKGKTTTTYFVNAILNEYLKNTENKSAFLSSLEMCNGISRVPSKLTTPESLELQKTIYESVNNNSKYLTMEVSSQAIKLNRIDNILYDIGVFLNISEDHISPLEHKTFEEYLNYKLELFKISKNVVINKDSDYLDVILNATTSKNNVITYSMTDKSADIYINKIEKINNVWNFEVVTPSYKKEFKLSVPGKFNVSNALAAISISYILDIPTSYIESALKTVKVNGRMELYSNKDNTIHAIVDYAHNKLSFENIFNSIITEYPNSNIISLFGSTGNKAYVRRKDLGTIAGKHSKICILTADDPAYEKVEDICKDIATYIEEQNGNYIIIPDRSEAVKKAVELANPGDVILLAGKGNETTQKVNGKIEEYESDSVLVQKYLKNK